MSFLHFSRDTSDRLPRSGWLLLYRRFEPRNSTQQNSIRRRLIVKYKAKQKVIIEKAEDYWIYSGNEDEHVITRLRNIRKRINFLQSEII